MQDRQVIVLTRNYSTGLSVIRSLGVAGFPVELIASVPKEGACEIAAASKYVTGFAEVVAKKVRDDADDSELIAAIMQYAGRYEEKPILFPTDDYTTAIMDQHRSELVPYFLMPSVQNGVDGTLAGLMDKLVQAEMAKKVGLLVPRAWKIDLRNEDISIPADMVYPCYCKPVRSIEGYKTEMAVCETEEELLTHLRLMRSHFAGRDVLVQEYLAIDQEIAIAGACLTDHVVIPAVIRKTRVGQHGRGVTLTGQMAPFAEIGADIPEKAFALLRSFGYHGAFGMEFNIVGDKVYFNEVNLRSAGESFAYYQCGINLPLLFVRSLLGEKIDPAEERMERYGQTLIYDKIAWEDCIYGYLSRDELDECLATADIKILCNDDDPRPGELFVQKNLEKLENEEKKRRNRQAREECMEAAMQATGWDREYAAAHLKSTRERFDITLNEYKKYEFYLTAEEKQEELYGKVLKDRKHRQQRKECIQAAMEKNGWSREEAAAQLNDARERLNITYKDYLKYEFYAIPAQQQAEAYEKILTKRERIRQQKEECIDLVTQQTGLSREEAINQINDARERLGISYKDYKKYEFWQVPIEKQQSTYEKIKRVKGGGKRGE